MADQLVTTAQVKTRLTVADATDDALISDLIDQCTDYIQEFTRRKLVPDNGATYYVDTAPGSVIEVRRGIRSVTSLAIASVDSPDDGSGTYTAIAAADILLRPSSIELRPGWPPTRILIRNASIGRLVSATNGAKIVGNFGFAAVPPELQAVALDAVVIAYNTRQGASEAIGEEAAPVAVWGRYFGRGTVQRDTLERYRAGAGIA